MSRVTLDNLRVLIPGHGPCTLDDLIQVLLDSGTLVIRRDENGEWPWSAVSMLNRWGADWEDSGPAAAILDALASSQGVEPQPPRYPDWRASDPDWVVEGVEP